MKNPNSTFNMFFKTLKDGRRVFYPWGIFGKGYILKDKSLEFEIKRQLWRRVAYPVLGLIIIAMFLSVFYAIVFLLIFVPAALLFYRSWFLRSLKGSKITEEKLSFKDTWDSVE